MRQSFDWPLLRTRCGRPLLTSSSPGYSTDGTIPLADRRSLPPNIVPATVSARPLPLHISKALRTDRYECALSLQLAPCSGHAANSCIARTQVGGGDRDF